MKCYTGELPTAASAQAGAATEKIQFPGKAKEQVLRRDNVSLSCLVQTHLWTQSFPFPSCPQILQPGVPRFPWVNLQFTVSPLWSQGRTERHNYFFRWWWEVGFCVNSVRASVASLYEMQTHSQNQSVKTTSFRVGGASDEWCKHRNSGGQVGHIPN